MIYKKQVVFASNDMYKGLFPENYVDDCITSFRFLWKHVESVNNLSELETQAYVMQQGERRFVIAGFDKTGELSFFFEDFEKNNQDFYDRVKDLPGDRWKFIHTSSKNLGMGYKGEVDFNEMATRLSFEVPKTMCFTLTR